MEAKNIICVLLVGLLSQSCVTQALWDATDPHEFLWIPETDITELTLMENGVHYSRHRTKDLSGYFVEKSAARKLSDYSVRLSATPVTVVVDGIGCTVVGVAYLLTTDPRLAADLLRILVH